jgi:hypothetical protein
MRVKKLFIFITLVIVSFNLKASYSEASIICGGGLDLVKGTAIALEIPILISKSDIVKSEESSSTGVKFDSEIDFLVRPNNSLFSFSAINIEQAEGLSSSLSHYKSYHQVWKFYQQDKHTKIGWNHDSTLHTSLKISQKIENEEDTNEPFFNIVSIVLLDSALEKYKSYYILNELTTLNIDIDHDSSFSVQYSSPKDNYVLGSYFKVDFSGPRFKTTKDYFNRLNCYLFI